MKSWTIRQRIVASFSVILALMVIMTVVAYVHLDRIKVQTLAEERDSVPGMYYSAALREVWSTNFLLTGQLVLGQEPDARARTEAHLVASTAELDKLMPEYEATVFTAEDRQAFDAFKVAHAAYMRIDDEIMRTASDPARQKEAEARLEAQLRPEFERGDAALEAAVSMNRATAETSAKEIESSVTVAKTSVLGSLVIALGLGLICGVSLFRAITQPLGTLTGAVDVLRKGDFSRRVDIRRHDELGTLAEGFNRMTDDLTALVGQVQSSGIKVNTSVVEIAATAKQQQATANEIAATTTEIGATSREISATSKELVKTMNEVSNVAEQAAVLAGSGQTALAQMEATIRQVMEAAGSVNNKLATLNEKAGDISQVVTTITKVADQTNLLSLNAAIEAEKAGEYGRGFAVVATEIRRLADQTAVATLDIGQMVKAIQSSVSAGVMSMDKFSEEVRRGMQAVRDVSGTLSQVIHQVQALAPRFEAVTEGMEAQATGAEQITEALSQLSEATHQTVDSLRESSNAIEELNQVAAGLRTGVSRFTLAA